MTVIFDHYVIVCLLQVLLNLGHSSPIPYVVWDAAGFCLWSGMLQVFYAYSKNSGRALSVTPVRPVRPYVRLSVRTSHFPVQAITPKPYGIYS